MPPWAFLAIGLMVNAKKSLSSNQLARDLDMNQKSAWYMQQRIRAAMLTDEGELLQGIVEADETFFLFSDVVELLLANFWTLDLKRMTSNARESEFQRTSIHALS